MMDGIGVFGESLKGLGASAVTVNGVWEFSANSADTKQILLDQAGTATLFSVDEDTPFGFIQKIRNNVKNILPRISANEGAVALKQDKLAPRTSPNMILKPPVNAGEQPIQEPQILEALSLDEVILLLKNWTTIGEITDPAIKAIYARLNRGGMLLVGATTGAIGQAATPSLEKTLGTPYCYIELRRNNSDDCELHIIPTWHGQTVNMVDYLIKVNQPMSKPAISGVFSRLQQSNVPQVCTLTEAANITFTANVQGIINGIWHLNLRFKNAVAVTANMTTALAIASVALPTTNAVFNLISGTWNECVPLWNWNGNGYRQVGNATYYSKTLRYNVSEALAANVELAFTMHVPLQWW